MISFLIDLLLFFLDFGSMLGSKIYLKSIKHQSKITSKMTSFLIDVM